MKLSRVNSLLLILVTGVNLFVIVSPFAPRLWFWWRQRSNSSAQLVQEIHQPRASHDKRQQNSITIPSVLLKNIPIVENQNPYVALEKGAWRWPGGGTPDRGGNTVLAGHRFTYADPRGPFYLLNKVRSGDEIGVTWNNRQYLYKVDKTTVVPPTQVSILAPTEQPMLTLYTCTPLWWPKDRLVITAHLEKML